MSYVGICIEFVVNIFFSFLNVLRGKRNVLFIFVVFLFLVCVFYRLLNEYWLYGFKLVKVRDWVMGVNLGSGGNRDSGFSYL